MIVCPTPMPAYVHAFLNALVGALASRVPTSTAECPLCFAVAGVSVHVAFTRLGRVTGRQSRAEANAGGHGGGAGKGDGRDRAEVASDALLLATTTGLGWVVLT